MSNNETKKVLTVVDRSTKALLAAAAGLNDVVSQAQQATGLLTSLATDIEFSQNRLDSIDAEYAEKQKVLEAEVANKSRSLQADLALQVKENKQKVLATLQVELGLANISKVDLEDLKKDLEYAQREIQKEIADAVEVAEAKVVAKYQQELNARISEHKVEIAQYQANATAQQSQIEVLKNTIADLRAQQDKDREAQVEIAKARSGEQTNINVGKG